MNHRLQRWKRRSVDVPYVVFCPCPLPLYGTLTPLPVFVCLAQKEGEDDKRVKVIHERNTSRTILLSNTFRVSLKLNISKDLSYGVHGETKTTSSELDFPAKNQLTNALRGSDFATKISLRYPEPYAAQTLEVYSQEPESRCRICEQLSALNCRYGYLYYY
jgi:hypothetical protein